MRRATLGELKVRTKGDLTGYVAKLTKGVPQSAPSSPIYFNAYIDDIARKVRRKTAYGEIGRRTVTLVADDVLLQKASGRMLQEVQDAASWWTGRKESKWSIPKCTSLQRAGDQNKTVYLDGEPLKTAPQESYIGMMLSSAGIQREKYLQRSKSTEAEVMGLTNCTWWLTNVHTRQISPDLMVH